MSKSFLNHGSRLRNDISSIFEYCFIVEIDEESKSGTKFIFKYPTTEDDDVKNVMIEKSLAFCFPFHTNSRDVRGGHFTFTFTDLDGNYQFGFCKVYPKTKTCYCIGSFLPWFEIFYKLLNYMHELLSKTSDQEKLCSFLDLLSSREVPPPGERLQLNESLSFDVPDQNDLASIPENRNISEYKAAVSNSFMVEVFGHMMNERRIVFTSSNLSTLTACVYSAEALLRPLHWQHIFIPVLPPRMIDHVYAPMPFIVGLHRSLLPQIDRMVAQGEEIVVCDVDRGTVQAPEYRDEEEDGSELPPDSVSFLKSLLRKSDICVGTNLSLAFMRVQARLVGTYRHGLTIHHDQNKKLVFDVDKFIDSFKASSSLREFAKRIAQLQCFKEFVEGRVKMLNSGVGFRDHFEMEINAVDDLAKRNDWYKKSGNAIMSQYKKARHNIKNLPNALKQQQQNFEAADPHRLQRSKTLSEQPQRLRPSRPISTLSTREPPSPSERPSRPARPPRPPPPRFSSDQLRKMNDTATRTRKYTPLDFRQSPQDQVDGGGDEDAPKYRTFSDAFDPPNVELMADIEDHFDEIKRKNGEVSSQEGSAATTPEEANPSDHHLLIDFSEDGANTSSSLPCPPAPPPPLAATTSTIAAHSLYHNMLEAEAPHSSRLLSNSPVIEPSPVYLDNVDLLAADEDRLNQEPTAKTAASPASPFDDDFFAAPPQHDRTGQRDEDSSSAAAAATSTSSDWFGELTIDTGAANDLMWSTPASTTAAAPITTSSVLASVATSNSASSWSNPGRMGRADTLGEGRRAPAAITRTGSQHIDKSNVRRQASPDAFSDILTMWKKREGI